MSASFDFLPVEDLADQQLSLVLVLCQPAEVSHWGVPAYHFQMRVPGTEGVGQIRLRVGWNEDIVRFAGHIGYAVGPAWRGRHFAERSCRLLLPLARRHGLRELWLTCQPDNVASRRTLLRLGALERGIIDVPPAYPMDAGAERRKRCFSLLL